MSNSITYPGKFITLEGGDGTGKSTQARLLNEYIQANFNTNVLLTREPGGAPGADEIRELILTGDPDRWDAVGETLLFYASRRNHLRLTVWPALEVGTFVISDRFADSTMAYQGYGNQLGVENVQKIHDVTVGDFEPDLTLILDIDVARGLARTQGRSHNEDRFEKMDLSMHERMRQGFFDIAEKNKHRCVIVDADRPIDEIQSDLRAIVKERLFS
ncbi:dTMP kinase [Sneathiella aquimaris]|uniref:dTMP kinase n=1 Tax=Sneathiella aquimaris TaxID=2599305 RepID=UPI00146D5B52|nr:dTMP kinase [Sneathiella aquimaris]